MNKTTKMYNMTAFIPQLKITLVVCNNNCNLFNMITFKLISKNNTFSVKQLKNVRFKNT